jgi:hypothetical protein
MGDGSLLLNSSGFKNNFSNAPAAFPSESSSSGPIEGSEESEISGDVDHILKGV